MYLYELTSEQQTFAEQNHDLVYDFLQDKKLPMNDYYDVVVFGYLRAVQQYCSRDELRQRFTFSAVAYRKMKDDLYRHFKQQSCPSRKAVTVSIESLLYDGETLTMAEVIAAPDQLRETAEANLIWERLSGLLTSEQLEALRLRLGGYTDREIAASRNRRLSDIKGLFDGIRAAAFSLCLI
jgi:RNA polymerase sigma-70 factor (ECF subfamily)